MLDLNFLKNFDVVFNSSLFNIIILFSSIFVEYSIVWSLFNIIITIINVIAITIVGLLNLKSSFDAILDIYINIIIIPPINVINRIYPNQEVFIIIDVFKHINIVCIISIVPIDKGWFIDGVIIEFIIIIIILNLIQ